MRPLPFKSARITRIHTLPVLQPLGPHRLSGFPHYSFIITRSRLIAEDVCSPSQIHHCNFLSMGNSIRTLLVSLPQSSRLQPLKLFNLLLTPRHRQIVVSVRNRICRRKPYDPERCDPSGSQQPPKLSRTPVHDAIYSRPGRGGASTIDRCIIVRHPATG